MTQPTPSCPASHPNAECWGHAARFSTSWTETTRTPPTNSSLMTPLHTCDWPGVRFYFSAHGGKMRGWNGGPSSCQVSVPNGHQILLFWRKISELFCQTMLDCIMGAYDMSIPLFSTNKWVCPETGCPSLVHHPFPHDLVQTLKKKWIRNPGITFFLHTSAHHSYLHFQTPMYQPRFWPSGFKVSSCLAGLACRIWEHLCHKRTHLGSYGLVGKKSIPYTFDI